MRTLEEEIRSEAKHYADYRVDTVFVGGGTPTAVDPEALCKVLTAVKESFFLAKGAEVTVEANPGTVNRDTLFMLRNAGVNRLSIGLQSTDGEELSLLGRIHTYEDFLATYHLAVEAGFRNLNVDLMMALPGQRVCDYEKTLRRILSLQPLPTHISAYSLIIEEGTPFFERYGEQSREMERTGEAAVFKAPEGGMCPETPKERQNRLPDEEQELMMDALTEKLLLQAGYRRYEISNYCLDGFACKHNTVYWRRGNYVGFGLGAASMVENVRFRNADKLSDYLDAPCKTAERTPLSIPEQMAEFLFLGLRLTDGVSKSRFAECFGVSMEEVYGEVLQKNAMDGLLENGERVFLTERGRDVSNYVMAQFLLDDY